MKKGNLAKKILVKSLPGFTLGVTLLMLAYASVYFVVDESTFIIEIIKLQNIKTLITQMTFMGIAYYILFIEFNIFLILQDKVTINKHVKNHPYIFSVVVPLIIMLVVIFVVEYLILNQKIYSEIISKLNLIISVIIISLSILCIIIKSFIESDLIKKINKKLSEKNS